MSATNLQNFSGDVQIRGTTFIKANTATNNLAIGTDAGTTAQGDQTVAVGHNAGNTSQSLRGVAVGGYSGNSEQGDYAVAMGWTAGQTSQGDRSVAIGQLAGNSEQGTSAVAVGRAAGQSAQGTLTVAIGYQAGETGQGTETVAVGNGAGMSAQGAFSTALGSLAGRISQGIVATAIGRAAGMVSQGAFAIAIGYRAGYSEQGAHSIILNGTNAAFNSTTASSFHVKPVRGGNMTASALSYTADGEIVEQTNIHFGSGNLGIGTAAPASTMHIYKAATDQTTGLLIEKANGGSGSANAFFCVASNSGETNNVGVPKAGIMFERTAGNGRGDLKFCVDYTDDTNPVGVADANMTIKGSNGYVGIATTGPLAPLHVNGDIAVGASGALRRTADNDLINIYSGSDSTSPYIFMTGKSRSSNANKIGFRIAGADIM